MNPIRRLAGQTAIYGLPSIIGRILGFLLVPLYTRVFGLADYGTVNVFYAYAAFFTVLLTYGMETAFFRFNELEEHSEKVYTSGLISLVVSTVVFLVLALVFSGRIADWMEYPAHRDYVVWFAWILGLDALSAIPFARLRAQNKATRFASIKLLNILTNIALNLFFLLLCPWLLRHHPDAAITGLVRLMYNPSWGIEYIFISNLAASILTLAALSPEFFRVRWSFQPEIWRKMIVYALPLLFAGMAGIVNETFDRILLRYLLPPDIASDQVGIYGACYKVSILMTLFIQAYRFAAEPFFFAEAKKSDAREIYARVMNYFIITVSVIFLVTMLYLDDVFIYLIGSKFRVGKGVIPILMLANLFLGVYYNLSVWYKLTSKTIWGAWLTGIGAVITLVLNFWWIPLGPGSPIHGYYGAAWATFFCYGSMMVISYAVGQHYFSVPYQLRKILGYLGLAVLLYLVSRWVSPASAVVRVPFNTALLLVFLGVAAFFEWPRARASR
jgi:O-antigen/teichoic acid export membrane protein